LLVNALFRPSGTPFDSTLHASSGTASRYPLDTHSLRVGSSIADAPLATSAS